MTLKSANIGIIGGAGMLGSAMVKALLERGAVPAQRLWVSNRSGRAESLAAWPDLNLTTSAQALADNCDIVILCIPPAGFAKLEINLTGKLVISVMAGVSLGSLAAQTGAARVVRAISSPAAAHGLAYSPWVASASVTETDRALVTALLSACGLTDEVPTEAEVECFTALTGPVPGFVAFFADAMAHYATTQGVAPAIADRAIRQLFLSAGHMLATGPETPADHVAQMVDYAGTTAAGLRAMQKAGLGALIGQGLDASVEATRKIYPDQGPQ
ncbi:MAG: pyrroline-5-carboxylate reductase dimerization domain-containing protein [Pseudorhodobacter sp.]